MNTQKQHVEVFVDGKLVLSGYGVVEDECKLGGGYTEMVVQDENSEGNKYYNISIPYQQK